MPPWWTARWNRGGAPCAAVAGSVLTLALVGGGVTFATGQSGTSGGGVNVASSGPVGQTPTLAPATGTLPTATATPTPAAPDGDAATVTPSPSDAPTAGATDTPTAGAGTGEPSPPRPRAERTTPGSRRRRSITRL